MNIPVAIEDARLGAEFRRDLNYFELENPKEYSLYFEGFPIQNNLKVDLKSDASSRILKSDRYIITRERVMPSKVGSELVFNGASSIAAQLPNGNFVVT